MFRTRQPYRTVLGSGDDDSLSDLVELGAASLSHFSWKTEDLFEFNGR